MVFFYNTLSNPLEKRGTYSYLTKALINILLEEEVKPSNNDLCLVSW